MDTLKLKEGVGDIDTSCHDILDLFDLIHVQNLNPLALRGTGKTPIM